MKEENQSSKLEKMKENLQKLMKKRWALPALYLGLGALVLSAAIWLQATEPEIVQEGPDVDQSEIQDRNANFDINYEDALPVSKVSENIKMPVTNEANVKVVGSFFDYNLTEEENQAALVLYDNTYRQNKGIDIAMESGDTFDVAAALSGIVIKAEKDALFGNVVHIEHDNDLVTVYESLESLKVEKGQSLKQGSVIGQAGRSLYNQSAAIHVHFEIRQDGKALNPIDYFNQPITSLPSDDADDEDGDNEEDKDENAENQDQYQER
ncbi:M23 family metallopeptidase [Bacillaceae bacterium IKA-2]|nr:M23 family metallopeptidase [Bacillaceae bacterium IKA-2]